MQCCSRSCRGLSETVPRLGPFQRRRLLGSCLEPLHNAQPVVRVIVCAVFLGVHGRSNGAHHGE